MPKFERFAPWKRDSLPSANDPLAGWHCTYLNVSQPENAISVNQQINPLSDGDRIYLFGLGKRNFWTSANRPPSRTTLPIYERLATWKRDSWASANRPSSTMPLLISERFAARNVIPEEQLIDTVAGLHYTYLNDSQTYNAISEHQQIDPLSG